jgi:hypothetical protein
MPGFFNKSLTASKVKRSQYTGPLELIAQELATKGRGYSDIIKSFLPELEARPDRAYAAADAANFRPIQQQYLDIAKNPTQDELTKHYQDLERQQVNAGLAARGLVGQGVGEGLTAKNEQNLSADALARADTRRLSATSAADTIEGNLQGRDYAGRNQVLGNIENIGQTDLGYTAAPASVYQNLLGYDAQRYSQDANLEANAMSPFEQLLGTAVSLVGAYMGGSASMPASSRAAGPSAGGGGGGGMSGAGYGQAGGQVDLYGNPTQTGGYSLYDQSTGPAGSATGFKFDPSLYGLDAGGPSSRSGAYRFISG